MSDRTPEELALIKRGWFPSKYPGKCSNCGQQYAAGQLIVSRRTEGSFMRYLCCFEKPKADICAIVVP